MEVVRDIIKDIVSIIFYFLYSNGAIILYMFSVPRILHFMQLEGYKNSDYIRWLTKNPKLAFKTNLKQLLAIGGFYLIVTIVNVLSIGKVSSNSALLVLVIECIAMFIVFVVANISQILRDKKERKKSKKPLVYTARAKRLIFWNFFTVGVLEISFLGNLQEVNVMIKLLLER